MLEATGVLGSNSSRLGNVGESFARSRAIKAGLCDASLVSEMFSRDRGLYKKAGGDSEHHNCPNDK